MDQLHIRAQLNLTTSEGIKESKKGFFQVDISKEEATPDWLELDALDHNFHLKQIMMNYLNQLMRFLKKFQNFRKKPIVEIKIQGDNIETDHIQTQIAKPKFTQFYRCFWRISTNQKGFRLFCIFR